LGGIVLLLVVVRPSIGKIQDLNRDQDLARGTLDMLSSKVDQLESFADNSQLLEVDFAAFDKAIPSESDVPGLLTQLQMIADEAKVEITSLQFSGGVGVRAVDAAAPSGTFSELRVKSTLKGKRSALLSLLRILESTSRIIDTESFSYTSEMEAGGDLHIEAVLVSYYTEERTLPYTVPINFDGSDTAFQRNLDLLGRLSSYDTEEAEEALASEAYTNSERGFSIYPPQGWSIDESGQFGTLAIFTNPQADQVGELSFNANISVISESAEGMSFDEYLGAARDSLSELLVGYQLVEDRSVTVSGFEAHILGGVFTQADLPLRNLYLLAFKDEVAYVLTATALSSTWDTYQSLIETSFLTLTIN
jgi:Tfp pilus assembly protein PilO